MMNGTPEDASVVLPTKSLRDWVGAHNPHIPTSHRGSGGLARPPPFAALGSTPTQPRTLAGVKGSLREQPTPATKVAWQPQCSTPMLLQNCGVGLPGLSRTTPIVKIWLVVG